MASAGEILQGRHLIIKGDIIHVEWMLRRKGHIRSSGFWGFFLQIDPLFRGMV